MSAWDSKDPGGSTGVPISLISSIPGDIFQMTLTYPKE
jgi:hypothetical protein